MNTITKEQALLSVAETARVMGVSTSHIWRLVSSGRFGPALLRVGRLRRVRRAELEAWILAGLPSPTKWEWDAAAGLNNRGQKKGQGHVRGLAR